MQKKPTIKKLLLKYKKYITPIDLELIMAHSIKKSREFVLCHYDYILNKKELDFFEKNIKRKISKEPLAYIVGNKEFFNLNFKINENVLIPRPETELLVENVLAESAKTLKRKTIIDIGTGSGNIIISLAKNITEKNIEFYGIDTSKKALNVAKNNASVHGLSKNVILLHGNLLQPLIKKNFFQKEKTTFFIVANLPYLSKEIYNSCPKNVKNFEPRKALLSECNGLKHYKQLLSQLANIHKEALLKKIVVFFEISPEQKRELEQLVNSFFPTTKVKFKKDLQKKWRLCKFHINNKKY